MGQFAITNQQSRVCGQGYETERRNNGNWTAIESIGLDTGAALPSAHCV